MCDLVCDSDRHHLEKCDTGVTAENAIREGKGASTHSFGAAGLGRCYAADFGIVHYIPISVPMSHRSVRQVNETHVESG